MSTEADWKHLRSLKPVVLDRLCERILNEVVRTSRAPGKSNHERYLAVYRLIQRRDREIAEAFNDMRRSTALYSILAMHRLGLFTTEEIAGFGEFVRAQIEPDSPDDESERGDDA
ncbi:MAG: peptide ABC transporter substrate-binding protein [Rhodanobacteraceae bacterium]|nr:peptide ABC transporter substrate-binding protein [Rhodanobacteraceae bacterium]